MLKEKRENKLSLSRSEQNHIGELFKKYNVKWVGIVSVWTFFLASGFHYVSEQILLRSSLLPSFFILILIILLGVFFDMIGIAVAVASEKPFHAMAADRIPSARNAICLLKNAGIVSNFCNDVVGDICGIVSGVAAATILLNIGHNMNASQRIVATLVLGGFVASLTVAGKAIGKNVALEKSHAIVHAVSKFAQIQRFINSN